MIRTLHVPRRAATFRGQSGRTAKNQLHVELKTALEALPAELGELAWARLLTGAPGRGDLDGVTPAVKYTMRTWHAAS